MAKTLSTTAAVFAAFLIGVNFYGADVGAAGSLDRQYAPGNGVEHRQGFTLGHPKNPETWFTLAEWLSEQAKDATLPPDAARTLILRGLEVNEQALSLNPDYYRALTLKAALLRQRATSEKDSSVRKKLIAEAEAYSIKAADIAKRRRDGPLAAF